MIFNYTFKLFIIKLKLYFNLMIGKKYLVDNDVHVIHRISKINDKCKIENIEHLEYLSKSTCEVYKIYDFSYKNCVYCNKNIVIN